MTKSHISIIFLFLGIFIIDQNIKYFFIDGFRYYTDCIDLTLAYNKGVAFSMFSFLEEYLKWIQIVILIAVVVYAFYEKLKEYIFPLTIIISSGASNIYDRFIHGGVVDYVYWHCGFDFAIFNFADVMIDFGVVWILLIHYKIAKNS